MFWEYSWPVVIWSIDPAVQEVVVAVWKSLDIFEVLDSSCFVEFLSIFITEWQVSYVEVAVLCVTHPFFEECSLDSVHWPIPGVLALHNVKVTIHSKSHN